MSLVDLATNQFFLYIIWSVGLLPGTKAVSKMAFGLKEYRLVTGVRKPLIMLLEEMKPGMLLRKL